MTAAEGLLVALAACTLSLDAYAVWRVVKSGYYSRAQFLGQVALIVCAPVIGAWLAIYMARTDVPVFKTPRVEQVSDTGTDGDCSNVDYHG